jgi:acyl CoA:acetate/3-ketoacid CoA transferase
VFALTAQGLDLVEVAPGIDVDRDVIPQVEFPFTVSATSIGAPA